MFSSRPSRPHSSRHSSFPGSASSRGTTGGFDNGDNERRDGDHVSECQRDWECFNGQEDGYDSTEIKLRKKTLQGCGEYEMFPGEKKHGFEGAGEKHKSKKERGSIEKGKSQPEDEGRDCGQSDVPGAHNGGGGVFNLNSPMRTSFNDATPLCQGEFSNHDKQVDGSVDSRMNPGWLEARVRQDSSITRRANDTSSALDRFYLRSSVDETSSEHSRVASSKKRRRTASRSHRRAVRPHRYKPSSSRPNPASTDIQIGKEEGTGETRTERKRLESRFPSIRSNTPAAADRASRQRAKKRANSLRRDVLGSNPSPSTQVIHKIKRFSSGAESSPDTSSSSSRTPTSNRPTYAEEPGFEYIEVEGSDRSGNPSDYELYNESDGASFSNSKIAHWSDGFMTLDEPQRCTQYYAQSDLSNMEHAFCTFDNSYGSGISNKPSKSKKFDKTVQFSKVKPTTHRHGQSSFKPHKSAKLRESHMSITSSEFGHSDSPDADVSSNQYKDSNANTDPISYYSYHSHDPGESRKYKGFPVVNSNSPTSLVPSVASSNNLSRSIWKASVARSVRSQALAQGFSDKTKKASNVNLHRRGPNSVHSNETAVSNPVNQSKQSSRSVDSNNPEETAVEYPDEDGFYGSPWDPCVRNIVKAADLDLHRSYDTEEHALQVASAKKQSLPELPPSRPRPQRREKPLNDVDQLPEGWDMREPDLHTHDWEGQIKRCKERIEENIMPDFFRCRLRQYEAAVDHIRQIAEKEPVGLDRSTVERLGNLEKLRYLEKMRGNPQGHIQNIDAIMETYRSRKLKWNPQLVTFWSKGKQLSKPRPFDWDELEAIKKELATRGSFWVEGMSQPGPEYNLAYVTMVPQAWNPNIMAYRIIARLPNPEWQTVWWEEMEFIHDTGSSIMTLYHDDMLRLMGRWVPGAKIGYSPQTKGGPHPIPSVNSQQYIRPLESLGSSRVLTGNGWITMDIYEIEVSMLGMHFNLRRLCPWKRIQCGVMPGAWDPHNGFRSDGPWLRKMMHTYSAPTHDKIWVAGRRRDLNGHWADGKDFSNRKGPMPVEVEKDTDSLFDRPCRRIELPKDSKQNSNPFDSPRRFGRDTNALPLARMMPQPNGLFP